MPTALSHNKEAQLHDLSTVIERIVPSAVEPASSEKCAKNSTFTFVDLFAGIGGFHIAMHSVGGKCVFASEKDKHARRVYEENFEKWSPEIFTNGRFNDDIEKVDTDSFPPFDVLCAGFPCQPFSQAGLKLGFDDPRGNLFLWIRKIVKSTVDRQRRAKKRLPAVLLLENVKGLRGHDSGNTLRVILEAISELGYTPKYEVLNSRNFGLPQNRERIFIVAWRSSRKLDFQFPLGIDEMNEPIFAKAELIDRAKRTCVGQILLKDVGGYTISDRLFEGHLRRQREHRLKGNGFGFSEFSASSPYTSTISARYYKDGSEIMISQQNKNPRKLHPMEAARLQGFPVDDPINPFRIVVSDTQAYKQFGNSVSVPVVQALARQIVDQLLCR